MDSKTLIVRTLCNTTYSQSYSLWIWVSNHLSWQISYLRSWPRPPFIWQLPSMSCLTLDRPDSIVSKWTDIGSHSLNHRAVRHQNLFQSSYFVIPLPNRIIIMFLYYQTALPDNITEDKKCFRGSLTSITTVFYHYYEAQCHNTKKSHSRVLNHFYFISTKLNHQKYRIKFWWKYIDFMVLVRILVHGPLVHGWLSNFSFGGRSKNYQVDFEHLRANRPRRKPTIQSQKFS